MRKGDAGLIKELTAGYHVQPHRLAEAADTIQRLSDEVEAVKNANARMGGRLRQVYIAIDRGDLGDEFGRGSYHMRSKR